jgi:hypothetical protein
MEVASAVGLEAAHSGAAGSAGAWAGGVEGGGGEAAGSVGGWEEEWEVASGEGLGAARVVDLEEVLAVHLEGARLEAAGSVAV